MRVFRPCDSIEVAECWELALTRIDGPTALALTRQNLPQLRTNAPDDSPARRAATTRRSPRRSQGDAVRVRLRGRDRGGGPENWRNAASRRGWSRYPRWNCCWRSRPTGKAIIGNAPVKIAIEAAVRWGWDAVIGPDGEFVGMHGFGASAPAKDLFKHFGITAEAAVNAALKRLGVTVELEVKKDYLTPHIDRSRPAEPGDPP